MPTLEQIEATSRMVEEAESRLKGILAIDYVVPDYYALRPKKCMGGWGRQFFNISPAGKILPCHAAETITGLAFESVRAIIRLPGSGRTPRRSPLSRYRLDAGTVQELRIQGSRLRRLPLPGFALTGSAGNTDPACTLSPMHEQIFKAGGDRVCGGRQSLHLSQLLGWHRRARHRGRRLIVIGGTGSFNLARRRAAFPLYALYPSRYQPAAKVRAFIDFALQVIC